MTVPANVPPRPSGPPTASSLADIKDFDRLSRESLAIVRASAESWRNGAIAIIAVATGGLFLKGPTDFGRLGSVPRAVVSTLTVAALAAAVVGLWKLLEASAGTPRYATLPQIVAKFGSVRGSEVAAAQEAASAIRKGRILVIASLALIVVAIGTWWWTTPTTAAPAPLLEVQTDGQEFCGELASADDQVLRVQVAGESSDRDIAFDDLLNFRFVEECS